MNKMSLEENTADDFGLNESNRILYDQYRTNVDCNDKKAFDELELTKNSLPTFTTDKTTECNMNTNGNTNSGELTSFNCEQMNNNSSRYKQTGGDSDNNITTTNQLQIDECVDVVTSIDNNVNDDSTNIHDDDSLLIRRQSYTIISNYYHQSGDDNQQVSRFLHKRRRPTLLLADDICLTPSENPTLNERRLSDLIQLSTHSANNNKKRGIFNRMSSVLSADTGANLTVHDLPISFQVKHLGHCPAKGLWGIKHTRGPVDKMVKTAKNLPPGHILPHVKLTVSTTGIILHHQPITTQNNNNTDEFYSIETISYGVQDLVYTRVFSMIVVYENHQEKPHPFDCHAFVCESRNSARKLTYALAAAFQEYSKRVQEQAKTDPSSPVRKKFAIDLRTPEEMTNDIEEETEA